MMLITLRNDFHGSCIAIRANALPHVITPSQEKRVLRRAWHHRVPAHHSAGHE